ncbi:unnamed protein product [Closterium sp. NIES-53]
MPGSGGKHRGQHPNPADEQCTTHEAAGGKGSHECAATAAAGADHHRSRPPAKSRPDQFHLRRRYLHHLLHLHHLRSHRRRRRLLRLHRRLHRPRQLLQRPCPPCPCLRGVFR